MSLEIDHVIVCVSEGAPEAAALTGLGFVEGSSNTHPGQGTANRRFFFNNAYLELLWVSNPDEARQEPSRRTRLWDRWSKRNDGACPFSIALRPDTPSDDMALPFPTWAYHAPYLPPQVKIALALDTSLTEPDFFYLGFATRPDVKKREPVAHALPLGDLTSVRIVLPAEPRSAAARATRGLGLIDFQSGAGYLMELTFNHGAAAKSADVRPTLPLTLKW
jgi:Glyoxalase-like domain